MKSKAKSRAVEKLITVQPLIFNEGDIDEDQFQQWLELNEHGYVINFSRDFKWMKLHRASCGSLRTKGIKHTNTYSKACSLYTKVPREWASQHSNDQLWMCQLCID